MIIDRLKRALVWCCTLAPTLFFALALLLPLGVQANDIVLGMTRGDVHVLPAGRAKPLTAAQGLTVRSGDRVYTGRDGWTVLMVPDGSRVVLTANSEFLVRTYDQQRRSGTFALLSGMLRAIINPSPSSPPNYRFNTLTAVAGVRGTDYTLLHRGQANVLFGNNGTVEVQGQSTAAQPLTANTVVQTTRGALPTQPIAIETGSELARAQTLFNTITDAAPAEWSEAGKLPEIVARWNIGYSRYLADAGRHDEALHILQVALDLSDAPEIQADAHLERAAVFSRDPAQAQQAVQEYGLLLAPGFSGAQRETALYLTGVGLIQLKQPADARSRLEQYRREYPDGRYAARVETLLRSLDKP
jgi:hypothetical protein